MNFLEHIWTFTASPLPTLLTGKKGLSAVRISK